MARYEPEDILFKTSTIIYVVVLPQVLERDAN